MENLQENNKTSEELSEIELKSQVNMGEEKNKAIIHKDSSLRRLDESFKKHIELSEYKKSNILAYWINDFAEYHDEENIFDSTSLKVFKRGDIVKVNLGFNIGKELGGLHYCVVINKFDSPYSNTLNIIPLTSFKENRQYNKKTCIDLGDELYNLLSNKFKVELINLNSMISKINNTSQEEQIEQMDMLKNIGQKSDYLKKIKDEIDGMKHGSIARINQITTISKQRIFKTPILSGIRLSEESLNILDKKISNLFTK